MTAQEEKQIDELYSQEGISIADLDAEVKELRRHKEIAQEIIADLQKQNKRLYRERYTLQAVNMGLFLAAVFGVSVAFIAVAMCG